MAKFRRQHAIRRSGRSSYLGRTILVVLLCGFLIFGIFYLNRSSFLGLLDQESNLPDYSNPTDRFYLPNTQKGEIVHHENFSLSYYDRAEQAEWVAYYLTRESLQRPNVPRARRFNEDPAIKSRSAKYYDYRGSGYDRGHLVPAADMAFDHRAMQETFLMSNISPQLKAFNGGVWKELEENVRDWTYKFKGLYICSGPIFGSRPSKIGESEIWVPDSFFKVMLDIESSSPKGIAFILPNQVSYKHLSEYATSIDILEERTGFNFYDDLLEDGLEQKIESKIEIDLWPISKKRFDLRNTKWNRIQ